MYSIYGSQTLVLAASFLALLKEKLLYGEKLLLQKTKLLYSTKNMAFFSKPFFFHFPLRPLACNSFF